MQVEELLKMLRDAQLDDEAIKALLSEALASLKGDAEEAPVAKEDEEAKEKAEAEKILGVQL
jgi:hypothetical protein